MQYAGIYVNGNFYLSPSLSFLSWDSSLYCLVESSYTSSLPLSPLLKEKEKQMTCTMYMGIFWSKCGRTQYQTRPSDMWQFHIGTQGWSLKRNCVQRLFILVSKSNDKASCRMSWCSKVLRWSLQGQIPSWPTGRTSILSNKGIQYLRDAFSSCHHQYHHSLNHHFRQPLTPGQCPTGIWTWHATRPDSVLKMFGWHVT